MFVKQFLVGDDQNFAYLVADERSKSAVIIDPSYAPTSIYDFAISEGYTIRYVFITHDHYDHTNGNYDIFTLTGCKPLFYGNIDLISGITICNGVRLPFDYYEHREATVPEVRIIHTPGHTEDSMCLYIGDAVFTGDTLFVGKVGGTEDEVFARQLYNSLMHGDLSALPETTRVFPGHDYGAFPESTILQEYMHNPFLIQPDFESFYYLKQNWAAYKREHGIE
ncbi:MAG: MBL fold metallo-hydrolase [bacterium]|nr:MBL fold metallo-hydrolase [bacterium]